MKKVYLTAAILASSALAVTTAFGNVMIPTTANTALTIQDNSSGSVEVDQGNVFSK